MVSITGNFKKVVAKIQFFILLRAIIHSKIFERRHTWAGMPLLLNQKLMFRKKKAKYWARKG